MIKAIFLDFDGTIYSHNIKAIPDSAVFAIKKAQENGYKVFISTGRSLVEIHMFDLKDIKFDGYILNNGQVLLDKDLGIIELHYLEGKIKDKIIDLYNEKRISLTVTGFDFLHLNYVNQTVIDVLNSISTPLPKTVPYNGENFILSTIYVANDKERAEVEKLKEIAHVAWWHKDSVDISCKGTNKFEGIKKIIKNYHINIDETMAVGDSNNDIEMIENCKYSVAMGNSTDELLQIANYITSDIDDDGIYNAFKYFNVI